MAAYREPFLAAGEARRPTLSWPRQLPIAGTPADVVAIARDYAGWLSESPISNLFINAEPGHLTPADRKSVGEGKRASVRLHLGVRMNIQNTQTTHYELNDTQ